MSKNILIINGPNINLTGLREPGVYGSETLDDINNEIMVMAKEMGISVSFYQSNHEGGIIDKIHEAMTCFDGCIINAGAYTHYSYAIRDAISAVKIPFIEVHFSNIGAREEFRKTSVISPVVAGTIAGFGKNSYFLALSAINKLV